MNLSLIAALTPDRVIGNQNKLLWHLPAELQYFKTVTWGKTILMGRKTYESIGHALPGRRNIILSGQIGLQAENCEVVNSLAQALRLVKKDTTEVMVIGGAQLYSQLLTKAQRLYLTWVDCRLQGDTFFPQWHPEEWKEISRQTRYADLKNPYDLTFIILERITIKPK